MKFQEIFNNNKRLQIRNRVRTKFLNKSNLLNFGKTVISCVLALSLILMVPGSSLANETSDFSNKDSVYSQAETAAQAETISDNQAQTESFSDNQAQAETISDNQTQAEEILNDQTNTDVADATTADEATHDQSTTNSSDESTNNQNGDATSADNATEDQIAPKSDNESSKNQNTEATTSTTSSDTDYLHPNDNPNLSVILVKETPEASAPFKGVVSKLVKILINEITAAIEALVEEWASKDGDYALSVGKDGEDTVVYIHEYSFPNEDGSANWNPSYGGGIVIHGHVTFVIKDGVTFTVGKTLSDQDICEAGFLVSGDGNSLTICAGNDEGQTVRGSGQLIVYGGSESAAIGGTENTNRGRPNNGTNITIESLTVHAYGGSCAAAIGGGRYGCSDNIVINGGNIYAEGGSRGAGIGSGATGGTWDGPTIDWYKNDGQKVGGQGITINGGTIEAKGGRGAAGIGGGWDSDGHNIVINGGAVKATGGENGDTGEYYVDPACGIGCGDNYVSTCRGYNICVSGGSVEAIPGGAHTAGIGSSSGERSWGIKIDGGKVVAYAGECAAAIGGGYYCENESGWIEIAGDAEVRVNENTTYSGSEYTGIGSGVGGCGKSCNYIKIHKNAKVYAYGKDGAGIGSGRNGQCGNIELGDNCQIYAQNKGDGSAIGTGKNYGTFDPVYIYNEGNIRVEAHASNSKYAAIGWGKVNTNIVHVNGDVRVYTGLGVYREDFSSLWFTSDTNSNIFWDKNLYKENNILVKNDAYSGASLSASQKSDNPTVGYESSTSYEIASNFIYDTSAYDVEWYTDATGTQTTEAPLYASVKKKDSKNFDVYTCPNQDLSDYGVTPAGKYYLKVKGSYNGKTYYSEMLTYIVLQQSINVKSGSATKIDDGTPLKCEEITQQSAVIAKKTSGEETFEIKDFVIREACKFASQIGLGTCDNTFEYIIKDKYDANNYVINKSYGTLTIQNEYPVVQADDFTCKYDGETHYLNVKNVIGVDGSDITDACQIYFKTSEDGGATWSADTLYQTDENGNGNVKIIDSATVQVKWKVIYNGKDYEYNCGNNTMAIQARNISLSSKSASKEYDGEKLTADGITEAGDGFAEGEGFKEDPTATGWQLDVGSSANTINYTFESAKTKAINYNVTTYPGTLTVEKRSAPITIITTSASKQYDGTQLTAATESDWKYYGGTIAENETLVVEFVYSDATPAEDQAINVGNYSNSLASYKVENADGDDVTSYYTFTDPSCGTLTIYPRNITLTSGSELKVYQKAGDVAYNEEVKVTGDGLVSGEGLAYSGFPTVSEISYTPTANTFTYAAAAEGSNFKAGNYSVTQVYGSLMLVTELGISASDQVVTYDGKTHDFPVTVVDSGQGATVEVTYSTSEDGQTWTGYSSTVPSLTDVGLLYVKARAIKGVQTKGASYTVAVTQRQVSVATACASKPYDGTELVANEDSDVTISGQGFADGQGIEVTVSGSQTDVGSSPNTFTYNLTGGAKAENYNIAENPGTLTVTKNTAPIAITTGSDIQSYNGTPLSCTDYTATWGGSAVVNGKLCADDVLTVVPNGTITDVGTVKNDCTYQVLRGSKNVTSYYTFEEPSLGTLQVTPRSVVLSTSSASKVYDGTALTANKTSGEKLDYTVTGEGFISGQGFETINIAGTRTNAGSSSNNVTYTLNSATQASNYRITTEPGTLTVSKRKVTVTSGSKISTWSACESEGKIYNKDTCQISGDKFVDGEVQPGYPKGKTELVRPTTEPEYSVEAKNAIEFGWKDSGNPSNYEITQNLGTLMIVKDDAAGAVATGYEGVYDGQSHKGEIKTTLDSPTITYKVDGVEHEGEPVYTDECDHTVEVTITQGLLTATCTYKIVITKRDLKLKAGSASKIYDGTALTCSDYTIEGDGFADNEAQKIEMTGDSTITNVKLDEQERKIVSVNNEIKTLSDSGSFKTSNYNISYTNGSLKILKRPVIVYSLPLGWGKDTNSDDSGDNEAVKVVYDGKSHEQKQTIEVGKGQVEGIPEIPTMGFVEGQGGNIDGFKSFTDAGVYRNSFDLTLTSTTSKDNYNIKTIYGVVKITPRDIVLSSASDSKMYDGTPLTNEKVTDSGEYGGFVEGEGATYDVTGSQTEVGVSANTFTYALNTASNSETKAINYNITTDEGALTVYDNNTLRIECNNQQYEYDGNPHGEPAKAYIGDTPCDSTIFYSTDGGKLWDSDVAQLTEPGTLDVMVHVDKRGYERAEGSYKIIVTKNDPAPGSDESGANGKSGSNSGLTTATGDFAGWLAFGALLALACAGAVLASGKARQITYRLKFKNK